METKQNVLEKIVVKSIEFYFNTWSFSLNLTGDMCKVCGAYYLFSGEIEGISYIALGVLADNFDVYLRDNLAFDSPPYVKQKNMFYKRLYSYVRNMINK